MDIFSFLMKDVLSEINGTINFLCNYGFDKGAYGEFLTDNKLHMIEGVSKTLRNIYIPYRDKTTEIDVLMIHEKGLFVFESKNYSGWIFGSENQTQWTQMLNRNTKYRFYNPIKQNAAHIKVLSDYLKLDPDLMKSYIVFSERCELKKVPANTQRYTITHRYNLSTELRKDLACRNKVFNEEQIVNIYNKLKPLSEVSDEVKKQHIKDINDLKNNNHR